MTSAAWLHGIASGPPGGAVVDAVGTECHGESDPEPGQRLDERFAPQPCDYLDARGTAEQRENELTREERTRPHGRDPIGGYCPRDCGSTPAKVRKSVIRNVPFLAGSVGRQRGCVAR
jgi:hypothetical protein